MIKRTKLSTLPAGIAVGRTPHDQRKPVQWYSQHQYLSAAKARKSTRCVPHQKMTCFGWLRDEL